MRGERLPGVMRGVSPCTDCEERYPACHDHCPKDGRGEYGYHAWKKDIQDVKDKKKTYDEFIQNEYDEWNRRQRWRRKTF